MRTAVLILVANLLLAQGVYAAKRGEHRTSGDKEMEIVYLDADHALVRYVAWDGAVYTICKAKYEAPPELAEFTGDRTEEGIAGRITALRLIKDVAIGIGLDPEEKGPPQQMLYFICDLKTGHAAFFKSKENCDLALAEKWGITEYPKLLPPEVVMRNLERKFDFELVPPKPVGNVIPNRKIETREQLLTAVNAWLKDHQQSAWTMNELIGRTVDQAYTVAHDSLVLPLDPPVESFLVNLLKDRPFTHDIQLRTNERSEITLQTAPGAIVRQRQDWEKVINRQMSWTKLESARTDAQRQLPLPPHDTLSLDILATPVEIENWKKDQSKPTYWCIFLASAMTEKKQATQALPKGKVEAPTFVTTPGQLLDAINAWRRSAHEPALTLIEITVRVADEMFAINDAKGILGEEVELFLECLAKDTPFVYPMKISQGALVHPKVPDDTKISSGGELLPIPPRSKVSVDIWGSPGEPTAEDLAFGLAPTRVILSSVFPNEKDEKQKP